jgi:hypothetical protein
MNWIYDAEQVSTKVSSLNCANVVQFANRFTTPTLSECQDILNHITIAFSSILSCSYVVITSLSFPMLIRSSEARHI